MSAPKLSGRGGRDEVGSVSPSAGPTFIPGDPVFDAPIDEAERQLGIELGGGGWEALLGADEADDWAAQSEIEKRARTRAQDESLAAFERGHEERSRRITAQVSRSKLTEDVDQWHRWTWMPEPRQTASGVIWVADCDLCGPGHVHSAPTRQELCDLIDWHHPREDNPEVGCDFSRAGRDER